MPESQDASRASLNLRGGFSTGASLASCSMFPSCPQAAISSSPLLSRTVHTIPAAFSTPWNASTCRIGEGSTQSHTVHRAVSCALPHTQQIQQGSQTLRKVLPVFDKRHL